eukprot:807044-Amphidinium_carterae.3
MEKLTFSARERWTSTSCGAHTKAKRHPRREHHSPIICDGPADSTTQDRKGQRAAASFVPHWEPSCSSRPYHGASWPRVLQANLCAELTRSTASSYSRKALPASPASGGQVMHKYPRHVLPLFTYATPCSLFSPEPTATQWLDPSHMWAFAMSGRKGVEHWPYAYTHAHTHTPTCMHARAHARMIHALPGCIPCA